MNNIKAYSRLKLNSKIDIDKNATISRIKSET
jgi:hypothetical protein